MSRAITHMPHQNPLCRCTRRGGCRYDAKEPTQQSTLGRTATALSSSIDQPRPTPLTFRQQLGNEALVIGDVYKGRVVEEFLLVYVATAHCGPIDDQTRQERIALMCWRVMYGFRATPNPAVPDAAPCPEMASAFRKRMVTSNKKARVAHVCS